MNEFRGSFILYCKTGCFERQKPGCSLHRIARAFCCFLSSFACPKEERKKSTPASPDPAGFPYFATGAAGQMGENSHWHAAEHRRGCRKGDLHCLSAASLQSPGSIEEHRVSRLRRDKRHRVPFLWFVSLGKQRNEQNDFMLHTSAFSDKSYKKRLPKRQPFTEIN